MFLRVRHLCIGAMALHHLDLVPIGVCNKKEPGKGFTLMFEIHQLARVQPRIGKSLMFGIKVIHHNREMPISIAQIIGLGLVMVDGQLDLHVIFRIAQIDQCKAIKWKPPVYFQTKGFVVKFY